MKLWSRIAYGQSYLTSIRRGSSHSSCRSVDTVQGHEADYILSTLVRTEAAGFLKNDRRANVALTRSRSKLVIVCNMNFFLRRGGKKTLFGRFIQDMHQQSQVGQSQSPDVENRVLMSVACVVGTDFVMSGKTLDFLENKPCKWPSREAYCATVEREQSARLFYTIVSQSRNQYLDRILLRLLPNLLQCQHLVQARLLSQCTALRRQLQSTVTLRPLQVSARAHLPEPTQSNHHRRQSSTAATSSACYLSMKFFSP